MPHDTPEPSEAASRSAAVAASAELDESAVQQVERTLQVERGLRAERALRAAVRDANRLYAGSRVAVAVSDTAVAELVRGSLRQLGARLCWAADETADFSVTDVESQSEPWHSTPQHTPEARIAAAAALMPATRMLAAQLAEAHTLQGVRIAVSLVLEPKTAALALALRDAGALVHVFGAVSETQPEIAAALTRQGIEVSAPQQHDGGDAAAHTELDVAHAARVLDWQPELMIDDGAHLIRLAHTRNSGAALRTLRAASEETTSGVRPLHDMATVGELRIPVVAVNDARTKTEFDNRIGTGESCVFAIADALDPAAVGSVQLTPVTRESVAREPVGRTPDAARCGVAGAHWVVVGYGPVGVGVARAARALGARVSVVERDAVRALAALHEGFAAAPLRELLPSADVVVSATGIWHTLTEADVLRMRPGTAVAVAGGIDDEVALDELTLAGWGSAPEAGHPGVRRWWPPNSRDCSDTLSGPAGGVRVIANGGGVNYTIANGNPIEVMDLAFATQLAALAWLCENERVAGVYMLPRSAEERVARAALNARGGGADTAVQSFTGGAAQPWWVHRYRGEQS